MAPTDHDNTQEPHQNSRKLVELPEVHDGFGLWSFLVPSDACGGGLTEQTASQLQEMALEATGSPIQYPLVIDSSSEGLTKYCSDEDMALWAPTPGLSSRASSATLHTDFSDIYVNETYCPVFSMDCPELVTPYTLEPHSIDGQPIEQYLMARPDRVRQRHSPILNPRVTCGFRSSSIPASRSSCSDTDSIAEAAAPKQTSCGCGASFQTLADLERHAKDDSHKPFVCNAADCTASFARRDALLRHRILHDDQLGKSWECRLCDRYRGFEAFKRKDHLAQHMRKVHPHSADRRLSPKFCNIANCHFSGKDGRFGGFGTRKEHAKHMRTLHGQGIRDCEYPGCDRFGAHGFARDRDLRLHCEKMHLTVEMMSE